MYDQFYGLNYDPFRLTPSGRDVFAHPSFERARAYLEYGLLRAEGFVVVTGPPGSGKTTLIRELLSRLPEGTRYAQIETSRLGAEDLLRMVISRYEIRPESRDKATLIESLRDDLRRHSRTGGRTLLVVDEAQDLPVDALEELRLLTNLVEDDHPLLQIVLLGQPGLREVIRRPELEQFHQRTVASCRLKPLTEDESVQFVRFRLERAGWDGDPSITNAALRLLHAASEGIPRRLNLLASRLLLHGFAEAKHELAVADAVAALEEMEDEAVARWQSDVPALKRAEAQAQRPRGGPPASPPGREPPPAPSPAEADPQPVPPVATPEPAPAPSGPDPADPTPRQAAGPSDADADIIIPGATEPPPGRHSPPPGTRPAQTGATPPRVRPTLVVVCVAVAVLAVALVVVATTPIGDAMEAELQAWMSSLTLTPSDAITPSAVGGDPGESSGG